MSYFLKSVLIAISCILWSLPIFAQPANNECINAIPLTDLDDWCSSNNAFTNVDATASNFGDPLCFSNGGNDVWFSFTAIATDVVIVVEGATTVAPGGTLSRPEVTLYAGDCDGTINEQRCESDAAGNNIIDLYKGGLVIGTSYLIRVRGREFNEGTFQLCINNFNPPVFPGSDCITSSVLCDKTSFTIPQVVGFGNDPNEAGGSSCLGGFGNSESNSTWFSWIAANNGTLTLELEPLNETDDLDFIIYELPNGVNDCTGKSELRCMAAGQVAAAFPSPCLGVTGLRNGESDVSEQPGCDQNQSNFLAPLALEEGKAYAMMVNNFSGTGSGFNVSFGGDAEFLGPEPDMIVAPNSICAGASMTFTDNSTFALGNITSWEWSFGVGANPATSSNPTQIVTYNTPGVKSVALTVGTEDGCQVTLVNSNIFVDACCQTLNAISADETITDLICLTNPTGAVELVVSSNSPITDIVWEDGTTGANINNLFTGTYMVSITNEIGCDTTFTYDVGSPDGLNVVPDITMPACAGGMDGGVVLNPTGGVPPYQYSWAIGNTTNSITNIGVGIYEVTITDTENCELELAIDVRELELELDSNIPVVTAPSCFDTNDGSVIFSVSNGTAPYEFSFDGGTNFTPNNIFENLNSGVFDVIFRDASGCLGDTIVEVIPPDIIELTIEEVPISCFGADDGMAEVSAIGGVGGYQYLWSDPAGQTDSLATGLMPGQIMVTVTDANGCPMTTAISITEPPELNANITGVQDLICFGDSSGIISVEGIGGVPGYTYGLDSINFQTDSIFTGLEAGMYNVVVQDSMECLAATTVTLIEPEELVVELSRDTIIDLGFEAKLFSYVFPWLRPVSIQWSPSDEMDCGDCFTPTVLPTMSGQYFATIIDSTGCTSTDSLYITVNKNRPIFIPNAFSPNADGVNDFFTVFGNPAAQTVRLMRIYNRWGALMYEGQNLPLNAPSIGWDGRFKGEKMGMGVYVYYIEVGFIDGEVVVFEGDVSIVE